VGDLADIAFRRHYAQIYRYLLRRTGDHYQAEDLAQEVFASAASALSNFAPGQTPVLAWLYTVAQRRLIDARRRRRGTPLLVPLDEAYLEEVPPDYGPEIRRALCLALGRLSSSHRAVLTLTLFQGRSIRSASDALNVSEGAYKMRLQRALAALREELEREDMRP